MPFAGAGPSTPGARRPTLVLVFCTILGGPEGVSSMCTIGTNGLAAAPVEQMPLPIATFQVPGLDLDGSPQPAMSGCHQPSERFHGTVIPFAWFAQGLRLVDIADPFAPRELGHFLPDPADGEDRPSSNDVTIDDRGLVYLVDRVRGVDIIETNAFG